MYNQSGFDTPPPDNYLSLASKPQVPVFPLSNGNHFNEEKWSNLWTFQSTLYSTNYYDTS